MSHIRFVRHVLVLLSLSLWFPGDTSGQAIGLPDRDEIPPEIKHTPLTEFTSGMPLRIHATVTDNVGVSDVTLFYRRAGDSEYRDVKMFEVAPGSHIYAVDLPDTAGPRIEYFIQANDLAGNPALPDLLSDPYEITVPVMTTMKNNITQSPTAEPAQVLVHERDGISKWVWIGVGIVAVGALAGGLGSGGGSGSSTAATTGIDNTIGNNGTGNVTISAPVPLQ